MRFGTVELGDLESRVGQAADRALALELTLFDDLVKEVEARADDIARTAGALARLDVAAALAELAVEQRHVRPRSEEHTSELQSLMRISYAVFCLKKQKKTMQN